MFTLTYYLDELLDTKQQQIADAEINKVAEEE